VETAREVLTTLARRYAFGDLAALCEAGAAGLPPGVAGEVRLLCSFGQRLIDLDAEDFGLPERTGDPVVDAHRVPEDLLARARASRMPQSAKEDTRGALRTLGPAYALLLEVIEARWRRREMAALVAAVHIAAEYLPLLAWESALGRCATSCRTPCDVVTRLAPEVRDALTERCRLAREFAEGALVRLRHAAPVGHGFGVPNPDEVSDAWARTRRSLGRQPLGRRAAGEVRDYPLAGLPEVFSAAAGYPIVPDTLLRDVAARLVVMLGT
jgi:hypothetical protein